jgi:hypothetical protein
MANDFSTDREFKSVREPSDSLKEYYLKMYERNQTKFIRRSKLEMEHIGQEFEHNGKTLKLVGSIDPILMLVFDSNENKYYRIHSDLVTDGILNKS